MGLLLAQADLKAPVVIMTTVLGIIAAHLYVLGRVIQSLVARRPIVPYEPRRQFKRTLGVDIVMTILLIWIGLALVGNIALGAEESPAKPAAAAKQPPADAAKDKSADGAPRKVEPGDLDISTILKSQAIEALLIGAVITALVLGGGMKLGDFGFDTRRLGHDVWLGAATFVFIFVPVSAIQLALQHWVPYQHPLINSIEKPHGWLTDALAVVAAAVLAPALEELLFRVLIQGWLESLEGSRRKPNVMPVAAAAASEVLAGELPITEVAPIEAQPSAGSLDDNPYRSPSLSEPAPAVDAPPGWIGAWPILTSSLIFAFMHWGQGAAVVPLFVLALALGYVYQRTHRIWPSLTVHVLLNALTMITLLASRP